MELPLLLAGPILRRTTTDAIVVWIATTEAVRPSLTVYALDETPGGFARGADRSRPDAHGATSHRLGRRLWVHLVEARPAADRGFPVGRMLGYELLLDGRPLPAGLDEALRYGRFPGPSLFVPDPGDASRILYGSCRKAHGRGNDALAYGDAEIEAQASDPSRRPSALFLVGDQIYADDVPGPLIGRINELAEALVPDEPPIPGLPGPLSAIPVYRRADLARNEAGFTSGAALNHLFSFGEYMALSLMQWNPALWPALGDMKADRDRAIPRPRIVIGNNHRALEDYWAEQRLYEEEYYRCVRMRRVLGRVRRVLANCPSYMIFDDHDITDDWNITAQWRDRVMRHRPAGRRIVANGLAAYWACQGWGNEPTAFSEDLVDGVTAFAPSAAGDGPNLDDEARARRLTETVLAHGDWAFVAPTTPRALFLDTRTRRRMRDLPDDGLPWLIDGPALGRLGGLLANAGWRSGEPLLVVSATPLLGLAMLERIQGDLGRVVGAASLDFESWTASHDGLAAFLGTLLELAPGRCTILSGDVHYGFTTRGVFRQGTRTLAIEQLTASSLKNKSGHFANEALGKIFDWDDHATLAGGHGDGAWTLKREKFLHADDGDDPLTVDTHIGLLEIEAGQPLRNHLLTPGRWTVTLEPADRWADALLPPPTSRG